AASSCARSGRRRAGRRARRTRTGAPRVRRAGRTLGGAPRARSPRGGRSSSRPQISSEVHAPLMGFACLPAFAGARASLGFACRMAFARLRLAARDLLCAAQLAAFRAARGLAEIDHALGRREAAPLRELDEARRMPEPLQRGGLLALLLHERLLLAD